MPPRVISPLHLPVVPVGDSVVDSAREDALVLAFGDSVVDSAREDAVVLAVDPSANAAVDLAAADAGRARLVSASSACFQSRSTKLGGAEESGPRLLRGYGLGPPPDPFLPLGLAHADLGFTQGIVQREMEELQRKRIVTCVQALYAARYARDDKFPCKIEEGLFLGSVGAALNKPALKDLNITHILTIANSLDPAYPDEFIYKKIDVFDTPSTKLDKYFDECFSFIDEARNSGGGVLVHCFAGMSRSVTIVVAYLMKKHRMRLSDALSLVRSKRPQVAPNFGFMTQLENLEKSLGVN